MRSDDVGEIQEWLAQTGGLSEALLDEFGLTNFGYSARAVFTQVMERDGFLDIPYRVSFDFVAVQEICMKGALTQRMLNHPEMIDWGLSVVALARVSPGDHGAKFEALWEVERKIVVGCQRIILNTHVVV